MKDLVVLKCGSIVHKSLRDVYEYVHLLHVRIPTVNVSDGTSTTGDSNKSHVGHVDRHVGKFSTDCRNKSIESPCMSFVYIETIIKYEISEWSHVASMESQFLHTYFFIFIQYILYRHIIL